MYLWLTALSVLIIIVLPAPAAAYMRRKWGSAWIYFSAGAATFLVSQIIHLPLNRLLQELGVLPGSLPNGSDLIWAALILGLSAALSEELIRTAGFAILKKARHFGDGVLIGLGYGGIEAMIVAVILAASAGSFYYFQQLNLLPEGITSEQLSVIEQTIRTAENSPVLAFAPLVERIMALVYQVIFSILVLKAFQTKRWVYVVIAISYHALVDFAAVSAREYFESIWVTELLIAALLIPGLIWYWQQRSLAAGEAHPISGKLAKELPAFRYSLGKEWLYQLRTKRLIIVAAVFLLFGMVSPLLAKYTPELLSNIEGAEQFAALVPDRRLHNRRKYQFSSFYRVRGHRIRYRAGSGQL